MSNDDLKAAIAVGCLIASIGFLSIAFRSTNRPETEQEKKIRQAWGMTKRETLPLVCGIGFLITGAFIVLTVLAFKLAGAKP